MKSKVYTVSGARGSDCNVERIGESISLIYDCPACSKKQDYGLTPEPKRNYQLICRFCKVINIYPAMDFSSTTDWNEVSNGKRPKDGEKIFCKTYPAYADFFCIYNGKNDTLAEVSGNGVVFILFTDFTGYWKEIKENV